MCTVSILRQEAGLIFTMNRDEHRLRAGESPLQKWTLNDIDLISARDGQAGGTWAAFRPYDQSFAFLLNGYHDSDKAREFENSRGRIIPDLLSSNSSATFWDAFTFQDYPSFTLGHYRDGEIFITQWNGQISRQDNMSVTENIFFASSSVDQDAVCARHRKIFDDWCASQQEIKNHIPLCHLHNDVFLNTESRHTKSITQFDLSDHKATARYWSFESCDNTDISHLT